MSKLSGTSQEFLMLPPKPKRRLTKPTLRPDPTSLIAVIVFLELVIHALYVKQFGSNPEFSPAGIGTETAQVQNALLYDSNREVDHANSPEHAERLVRSFLTNWTDGAVEETMITNATSVSKASMLHPTMLNKSYPDLFIFRRTKKTGSSSMMNALMEVLEPLGYVPLPRKRIENDIAIRNEYAGAAPRRLLVLQHNNVTRAAHPRRHAVIADTIRDGFAHVTSYCRYMRKVHNCFSSGMRACLQDEKTLQQLRYRWTGREVEDDDTYIDLPLSSAHPALSTAVMKTVYPMIPLLNIQVYNLRGASCIDELKQRTGNERKEQSKREVKELYNDLYAPLDRQVDELKRRMLVIAGYPVHVRDERGADAIASGAELSELVDEAEKLEAARSSSRGFLQLRVFGKSERIIELLSEVQKWKRTENGSIALVRRRDNL